MSVEISGLPQLKEFSQFIEKNMGLHFPEDKMTDLQQGMASASKEFGFNQVESCIKWLLSSSLTNQQIEILASYLSIGETYFFRAEHDFHALENHILPELIHARKDKEKCLRIWSAGSASGEEPYSLAILVHKLIPDIKDWNITILATDINTRSLAKAEKGIYSNWSFRNSPEWLKKIYFTLLPDGGYQISQKIKDMVTFSYLNLARDAYPSLLNNTNGMDIIFCRNVLMYFTPELAQKVINNLHGSLIEKGWLVIPPIETTPDFSFKFDRVNFSDAILYQKGRGKDQQKFMKEKLPLSALAPFIPVNTTVKKPPEKDFIKYPKLQIRTAQKSEISPDFYQQALELYKDHQYSEAIKIILEFPLKKQKNPKVIILLARAYANQGKLSPALECIDQGIKENKINPQLYYLRSTILQELNLNEDSIQSLKKTIYLDPEFIPAYFTLGCIFHRHNKEPESHQYFKNALRLLDNLDKEKIILESEGMTAGRLKEIILSIEREAKSE